jgi:hypothetical protein
MSRRIRPAVNPATSHSVITTKAQGCGWSLATSPADEDGTTEMALTRDAWQIIVAFRAGKACAAVIQYPSQSRPMSVLAIGRLSRYLRGDREQMSAFDCGQRVIVGDKAGTITDIVPDEDTKVRLVVSYDDGTSGDPFTTHVRAEEKAAVPQ